jgi:hypothetical protein
VQTLSLVMIIFTKASRNGMMQPGVIY